MRDHRGLGGRLLDACTAVFAAALLLFIAVQLIQAIFWWLIGIAALVALVGLIVGLIRMRGQRW